MTEIGEPSSDIVVPVEAVGRARAQHNGRVTFRIIHHVSEERIPRALVCVEYPNGDQRIHRTDKHGEVRIVGALGGVYTLLAIAHLTPKDVKPVGGSK